MPTLNTLKQFFYALYLTNSYGLKLKKVKHSAEKTKLRLGYSKDQLESLNISIEVQGKENIPSEGEYLLVCNHRSIIDPPIIEVALMNSGLFGVWVSKKELYNSIFFGLFVRHAGSILLDRQKSQMSGFFADIKAANKEGYSIFIFPEGTRNKGSEVLGEFKEGSRLIALKNRLPILPVYIETDANQALENALKESKTKQTIQVHIGSMIDYKDKTPLRESYKKMFGLS